MKWFSQAISSQNLYLKLAIFLTGLVTGLESSLRQLLLQFGLFLAFFLFEPSLYRSLLKALRRILPFLAGYWVFVTIFAQSFPDSLFFSLQILYLLLVSVYVFGKLSFELVAYDSVGVRRFGICNYIYFYLIATYMYLKSFFTSYANLQRNNGSAPMLAQVSDILQAVAKETDSIRNRVRSLLNSPLEPQFPRHHVNLLGLLFLTLLVLLHSL